MKELLEYVSWLLGKWHQNGIHSISRDDMAQLEQLYLKAVTEGDELRHAVMEFVEAMNYPRGDAADQRRLQALSMMRRIHASIKNVKDGTMEEGYGRGSGTAL